MKNFILLFLFITTFLMAQPELSRDGGPYKGHLDSSAVAIDFYLPECNWIYISVLDTTSVTDSCVVQFDNMTNGNYTTVGIKDIVDFTLHDTLQMSIDIYGKMYFLFTPAPLGKGRLKFISGNGMEYYIWGRKQ